MASTIANVSNVAKEKPKFERLPTDVIPMVYRIELKTEFKDFFFFGTETIDVKVTSSVYQVSLNSDKLDILSVIFNDFLKASIELRPEEKLAVFKFNSALPIGEGKLVIKFKGKLSDSMAGYYLSNFKDDDGCDQHLAITHFEPTQARSAFPCWDEPIHKAVFYISLIVPKGLTGISNMPEIGRKDVEDGEFEQIDFGESPLMSTYLVAYAVGKLDYIEATDANGVVVRIYATRGRSKFGHFALDVACRTLPFYGEYFDQVYEQPKVDLIAVPDFAGGAMENWGLVTYRETALLIDSDNSSITARQHVALVVGHELAHMWFGNLVTMEWWTDLWLKEGFATWIEFLCVDFCYPEFDIWTHFTSFDLEHALRADALKSSHAIEIEVKSPEEIDEIFDAISYNKGASVIRMLNHFLGPEKFRDGLRIYLQRHKYSNARTAHLWAALEEVSGQPVATIMSSWTQQVGFPVVTVKAVTKDKTTEGLITHVELEQTRFLANRLENKSLSPPKAKRPRRGSKDSSCRTNTSSPSLWSVPVRICNPDNQSEIYSKVILDQSSMRVALPTPVAKVMIDPGAVGMYRVRYDGTLLKRLTGGLSQKTLPPRDRLSLVGNLFALADAGYTSLVSALEVVSTMKDEDEYAVWAQMAGCLSSVCNLLQEGDLCILGYTGFVITLAETVFKKLGTSEKPCESSKDSQLRALLLGVLANVGHPAALEAARCLFRTKQEGGQLSANLRGPVYAAVLKHGGLDDINALKEMHSSATMNEEQTRILRCLGHSPVSFHSEHVHSFLMSPAVRDQDRLFGLTSCASWSKAGRQLVWKFVQDNWTRLLTIYKGQFLLGRLILGVTQSAASLETAKEVEVFFNTHDNPNKRKVEQAIEAIMINAASLEANGTLCVKFFDKYH